MFNNFRTASATREDINTTKEALQKDIEYFMKPGSERGISAMKSDPKWVAKAGRLIRQVVVDQFALTDFLPFFVERREGTLGDTFEFEKLINTLRVVRFAPHSHPQVFTPRKAKYTINTAMYEHAFGIPLFKVATRQHTIGEYTDMSAESLVRHRAETVLTAIDVACSATQTDPKGRDVRTNAAGTDVSEAEIKAAVRNAVSMNSQITILGSRYALQPIFEFAKGEGGDTMKDEFQARGVVGSYRGARIVALDSDDYNEFYEKWTTVNGADIEKRIFIVGNAPGAILMERDLSLFDWEEIDARYGQFETGLRLDYGVLVHTPWRYHVIQLA